MSTFVLGARLSQGATCKVYDLRLKNTAVILKTCKKEYLGQAIFKFVNLRHDNIEHIAKIIILPKSPMAYIISERLDMTLFDFKVGKKSSSNKIDSKFIHDECTNGLIFIHGHLKLIHADVKNNNIMLSTSGHLKLIDFSNAFEPDRGRVDGFNQTILTMCHVDLLRNIYDVGFKLDMWALAMTLYWFEYGEHFLVRIIRNNYPMQTMEAFEVYIREAASRRHLLASLIDRELSAIAAAERSPFSELFIKCLVSKKAGS